MKSDEALNVPGAAMPTSSLLTVEDAARQARTLRWWCCADLQRLAARFDVLVDAWSQDWLGARRHAGEAAGTVVQDGCFEGAMALQSSAAWREARVDKAVWAGANALGPLGALHEMLFDGVRGKLGSADDHPVVAEEIVQTAWQDWRDRLSGLCTELELTEGTTPRVGFAGAAPWSGDVIVRVPWCGGEWQVALDGERVAALLGTPRGASWDAPDQSARSGMAPGRALMSLQAALGSQAVRLRAELPGVTLNLGQFHELRPGDVIVLSHALDQPLQILCDDQIPVCHGWLGQQRGQLALELTA